MLIKFSFCTAYDKQMEIFMCYVFYIGIFVTFLSFLHMLVWHQGVKNLQQYNANIETVELNFSAANNDQGMFARTSVLDVHLRPHRSVGKYQTYCKIPVVLQKQNGIKATRSEMHGNDILRSSPDQLFLATQAFYMTQNWKICQQTSKSLVLCTLIQA